MVVETLLADLGHLVSLHPVSDRPVLPLAGWLAERLEGVGFSAALHHAGPGKASVVARRGPPGTPGLVLSGHMDVVPALANAWSTAPDVLVRDGDRLRGRGTADMLGFLAAVLSAIPNVEVAPDRQLVLLWTHDEEVGCLGSALLSRELDGSGLPEACWVGEPTELRVLRMHPGHVVVRVELAGRAAHSSRTDLGANAVLGLGRALGALERLADDWHARRANLPEVERPWVTLNPGLVRGGRAVNIVPEQARLDLDLRPLPGMDVEPLVAELRSSLAAVPMPKGVRLQVVEAQRTASLHTPAGTPLEEALRPWATDGPVSATYATDGGNLASLGLRPLVFGPGSITAAHRPDEWIALPDLLHTADAVRDVAGRLCGRR